MTVLICGGSGILGRELSNLLLKNNCKYYSTYNSNLIENGIKINFMDKNEIEKYIIDLNIKICINCIVERQLETCENNWEYTKKTNIDITNNLAKVCNKNNVYLIHISTDYVFDGQNAPYYPDDQVNPLQNYGISKLISELKVKSNCKNHAIVRVPVLYSDNIKNLNETAVTLIGKKILNRIETFKEDNFSIRRPNFIPDFCKFIFDLVNENKIGTFHFCNPYDKLTKYEISLIISNFLNKKNNIIPINEEPKDGAERPKDTLLKDTKYDITKYTFTPIQLGLSKCFNKLYHPKLEINSKELNNIFLLIDLDGTLIDSDECHYYGYKECLKNLFNYELEFNKFIELIYNNQVDNFLIEKFGIENKNIIKKEKNDYMKKYENLKMIDGADKFINFIHDNNINHVVVTNTSLISVNIFKEKLPILSKIKNWITREDYTLPKPDKECYEIAKNKYFNNEKYIIGIENTYTGYLSLKNITSCIYIFTNKNNFDYNRIINEDAYIINNYENLFE